MKIGYLAIAATLFLTACNSSENNQAATASQVASQAAAAYIPTKKYADVQTMFADKNNYSPDDGSFKLIKKSPPEFLIAPMLSPQETQDGALSQYKYAALEGLLLTFAQTDAQELTVHIQPRIMNGAKPISDTSRQAVKLKITLHAKREDVANALHKMQIYDFDQLIEHQPNNITIAGSSQSRSFLNLRKSDESSWKLINQFRIDKHKFQNSGSLK
nr:hypothetical protein [uncultured Kingella sp.]